ncbi:MAG TPA: FAD-dependent oxidoreductase [Planctomycetota bacterium]|nr:FAD-dependent oxidoreductase [Planctomycetota bacterium]
MSSPGPCEVAFPQLTDAEMEVVASLGTRQRFPDGHVLIHEGEKDFPFFVVEHGAIVISESSTGEEHVVVEHLPGGFTGDVDMLTRRAAVITARAARGLQAIVVPAERMRRLLNELPAISDKLLHAFQTRRELLERSDSGFVGVRLLGRSDSPDAMRIQEFFYKNRVPYRFYDVAQDEGRALAEQRDIDLARLPAVVCRDAIVHQPTLPGIAHCLGISREVPDELLDLVIVGAGPSGLAAAVYAGSEGLRTMVLDMVGPGGQAGSSSKIENYMGFPAGLSGADLANRGFIQALKFGVTFNSPVSVQGIERRGDGTFELPLCSGQVARARAVLIATGVSYQRLPLEHCERLQGAGVFYAATSVEARLCRDALAMVVGGGNSAGQAAMYLAEHARGVKLILRGGDLWKSMSSYLAERVRKHPRIEILFHTEVDALAGDSHLRGVTLRNSRTGAQQAYDCPALFLFVGAKPATAWLPDTIARDAKGFLLTGSAAEASGLWRGTDAPCELETSLPGVFACGDVRSGTTKRCAFAVGDGALAVTCVHQALAR